MSRFVYFYIMKDTKAEIREAVPRHVAYWKSLKLDDHLGGPFADRSGGLYWSSESWVAMTRRNRLRMIRLWFFSPRPA
jgi:hypothetical protein